MLPKVIVHNSISLDGSLINFDVNLFLHYKIAGSFGADMHLVGSNTAKMGIEMFYNELPKETRDDFIKPNRKGILWAIPDSTGKLKGLLHVLRQSEFCRDVVVMLSEKTSKDYIRYLEERNYCYYVVGEDKCDLKQSLVLLSENHNARRILVDAGSILSNLLIKLELVSEVSLLIHPVLVGKKAYNMFANLDESAKLDLIKKECFEGGYFWTLYQF